MTKINFDFESFLDNFLNEINEKKEFDAKILHKEQNSFVKIQIIKNEKIYFLFMINYFNCLNAFMQSDHLIQNDIGSFSLDNKSENNNNVFALPCCDQTFAMNSIGLVFRPKTLYEKILEKILTEGIENDGSFA